MAAPVLPRAHHQKALHHTKGRNPGPYCEAGLGPLWLISPRWRSAKDEDVRERVGAVL